MGASSFVERSQGKSAKEAFRNAVEEAGYESGQGGYTGTIAEKSNFVMICCPSDKNPEEYAWELIEEGDRRIDDKHGPAGCIKVNDNTWIFFGFASS